MLTLYLEAPFAVCRTFTAGWYRPTATFLTPSAAYGLLLNLAGIETRLREEDTSHPGSVPASLMQSGLPPVKLALGASAFRRVQRQFVEIPDRHARFPKVQTVFQQLHNYPVGSSGGERAATTYGNKYNIAPVRREILVSLRVVLAMDGNSELEGRIRDGLSGNVAGRYGLPFLGDNAFLPDRIMPLNEPLAAHWYEQVASDDSKIRPQTTRLTVWIDRADLSQTRSELFAPTPEASSDIPASAWNMIEPP